MIKVLHLCTIPLTARAFIAPLARHLAGGGFEVTIAFSAEGGESGSATEELLQEGFRIRTVPIPRTIRPLADARAIWALYRFIRAERFALVHTQTSKGGFVGRVAAHLAGVPVIIHTAHAFPFHAYLHPIALRLYVLLERWAARWADLILVDTEAVRAEGLRHRVAPPEKLCTMPMGIDLEHFAPNRADGAAARREWGIAPDDLVVGTVARLVPDKGLECFLQAAARVSRAQPRARFLIVGGGPLRAALDQQARELGIDARVVFAGVRSDIPRQVAAMDLFVLPTKREGFGVVFAEAMAMGKPVVGSDIGPVREVVGAGETGVLLPPNDPDAFAEGILTLLADAPRRRAMGIAGRHRVEQRFDQRRIFERTEAEYRRLLAAKGVGTEDIR